MTTNPSMSINHQDVNVLMGCMGQFQGPLKEITVGVGAPSMRGWVDGWDGKDCCVSWSVEFPQAADYELAMIASSESRAVFEVTAAGQVLRAQLGDPWDRVRLGTVAMPSGPVTVSVRAASGDPKLALFSLELARPEALGEIRRRAARTRADTDWLAQDKYGFMFHWTSESKPRHGPAKPYAQAVLDFDVPRFADMVAQLGVAHVLLTTSHAGFWIPGPIRAVNEILPGRATDRDLIMEMADALAQRGIRFLLYFHCGHDDVPWWSRTGFDQDRGRYFELWQRIIREIGLRYGPKLAGWWFDDGMFCYYPCNPPWEQMTEAARAGNPRRLVGYNPWIFSCTTQFQDFYCGEMPLEPQTLFGSRHLAPGCSGRYSGGSLEGLQAAITTLMEKDSPWCHAASDAEIPPPAYETADLIERITYCIQRRIGLFLNLEIYQDGTISPDTHRQFLEVRKAIRG